MIDARSQFFGKLSVAMLKTLSLSAEDERGEDIEKAEHAESESRMMRSLEALSSQPAPDAGQPREQNLFRKSQGGAPREAFRGEPQHHANKARHRFVRDGEVQVVRAAVTRPRETGVAPPRQDPELGRLQMQIEDLKLRADQSERARKDAVDQFRALQTKLAHAELALNDAQLLAQSRAQEIQALQDGLVAARTEAAAAKPAPRAPAREPDAAITDLGIATATTDTPRRGPGRPRKIQPLALRPTDPEPVEWWLMPTKPKRR